MTINRAYKFRIYPTDKQKEFFAKTFGCVRFVYNKMLEEKKVYYKETKQILNITPAKYKSEFEWLKEIDSLALANAQLNLQKAYKNFFSIIKQNKGKIKIKKKSIEKKQKEPDYVFTDKDIEGLPRFKCRRNDQSYTTNNQGTTIHFSDDFSYIDLPKIKHVKVNTHRQIDGIIKSATISKNCANQYFISVLVECEEPIKLPKNNNKIGIDLGLKEFAITSNGEKIENPRYLRKSLDRLKTEQRKLSKCVKGSNNRIKQCLRLAKIYNKINNQRTDFLHKLSTRLINENQVICLETLKVDNMLKNHKLALSISDVSWSRFVDMLIYKAEWYGRTLIQVDTFFASSQICNVCGYKNQDTKDLSVRQWECPNCHTIHDRDENASKNILRKGLEQLSRQELPVEPVYALDTSLIEQEALSFRAV